MSFKSLFNSILLITLSYYAKGQFSVSPPKNFPDWAVFNVKTMYGAKGDGVTDDTEAIKSALRDHLPEGRNFTYAATLYFPAGTYIIQDNISALLEGTWRPGLRIQGQGVTKTIFKLAPNSPNFQDPANPRAVIHTASPGPEQGNGDGNEAYQNALNDFTLEVGAGNPGAIGIQFTGSNTGSVRNVLIKGQGLIGLNLATGTNGPLLVKNVKIEGFNTGIHIGTPYILTLEDITIENQQEVGILATGTVALRGFKSINAVPALIAPSQFEHVTLVNAELIGKSNAILGIDSRGALFARNITAKGYQWGLRQIITKNINGTFRDFPTDSIPGDSTIIEYASHLNDFGSFFNPSQGEWTTSLNLKVEATPEYHENDTTLWANVEDYGAKSRQSKGGAWDWQDDTDGIQAALNSGKPLIYFPQGPYLINRTLIVGPQVRKIIAPGAIFGVAWGSFGDSKNPQPLFLIEDGTAPEIIIEGFSVQGLLGGAPASYYYLVQHNTSRPLILKDLWGVPSYGNQESAGKLFVENVCCSPWYFEHPQKVYMRQLNVEGGGYRVYNKGADVWILGMKTETYLQGTLIETTGGGRSELLGASTYMNAVTDEVPFLINDESCMSATFSTNSHDRNQMRFTSFVEETIDGVTRELKSRNTIWRGNGEMVSLYVGCKKGTEPKEEEEPVDEEEIEDLLQSSNNIITPNSDGYNDTWRPGNLPFQSSYSLKIFNKMGKEVFVSNDIQQSWNGTFKGTSLPDGVYYYTINLDNSKPITGYISLIK